MPKLTKKIDKNFYDTLNILNNLKNINYCCTQGTMLGLFRDGELLPWDGDIDIIILSQKNGYEELINSMKAKGFIGGLHRRFRPNLPVIKFYRKGGRRVEFNSYIKNSKNQYCLEHYECEIPEVYKKLRLYQKFINKILKIIGRIPFQELQLGLKPCLFIENKFKKILCYLLRYFIPNINLINIWLRKFSHLDNLIGYYSSNLDPMKTRIIKYHGLDCLIPHETEKVCTDLYGSNWYEPKKSSHYTDYFKTNS